MRGKAGNHAGPQVAGAHQRTVTAGSTARLGLRLPAHCKCGPSRMRANGHRRSLGYPRCAAASHGARCFALLSRPAESSPAHASNIAIPTPKSIPKINTIMSVSRVLRQSARLPAAARRFSTSVSHSANDVYILSAARTATAKVRHLLSKEFSKANLAARSSTVASKPSPRPSSAPTPSRPPLSALASPLSS